MPFSKKKTSLVKNRTEQVKESKPYFTIGRGIKYYSLSELIDNEYSLEALEDLSFDFQYFDSNGKRFSIYFTTGFAPYCCGLVEIGSLSDEILPINTMNNLFKKLFKSDFTFIINTIQPAWEEYLGNSKYFGEVKTFNNPNTGNDVTVWISTN